MNHEHLRLLPAVDEVLNWIASEKIAAELSHAQRVATIRQVLQEQRLALASTTDANALTKSRMQQMVLDVLRQRFRVENLGGSCRVVNATGVVLHTNLGRAPLATHAKEKVAEACGYTNLEIALDSGARSTRGREVARRLCQLTGAQDALIVNNCAAATVLVLSSIARKHQVIISRGQLVEIGGGFRLPEVFEASGAELCEVGTTNRTYVADYENAINDQTAAILRVHRSNFQQSGFIFEPTIEELVASNRPAHIPVIDDIGSGWLTTSLPAESPLQNSAGFRKEPCVLRSVKAGSDLTLFSGDKLFGGPQCGIVLGKTQWIKRLRSSPLLRALRVDKLTLAALEATLDIHLDGRAAQDLPVMRMIEMDASLIYKRCEQVLDNLSASSAAKCEIVACRSQVGGGSVPDAALSSFAIQVQTGSSESCAYALRTQPTPILCRQSEGHVLLDLRTVQEDELASLAQGLQAVLDAADENSTS